MDLLTFLQIINYGLVLIFGLFLSVNIAGGWSTRRQKWFVIGLCPLLLLVQAVCWLRFGTDTVRKLYPLISHLPLVLLLVFGLKKSTGVALVSVCTGYLCCQIPRWVKLAVLGLFRAELAGEIGYILCLVPIFLLLQRFFVRSAHDAMTSSPRSLVLFGSLPLAYYCFDYATAVYSDVLYTGIQALNEFLPTVLIVFYMLFMAAYHAQAQKHSQSELQRTLLETELRQSRMEMDSLRRAELQTAIYQHDIRHHLTLIEGYLTTGNPQQASDYIRQVRSEVENITPRHWCGNETVNLLCSAFSHRAERDNIRLDIEVRLPDTLPVSDIELCSLLSNGLENALHAVAPLADALRWVKLYCAVRANQLLIELQNPYAGEILFKDGLPVSVKEGHGYGCQSIRSISQRLHGHCSFEPGDGVFTLRIVLPMQSNHS